MKKITRAVQKINAEVIGLDVHQGLIVYSRFDRKGDEIACGELPTGRRVLEDWLDKAVGRRRTHLALEASGGMLWVYDLLVSRYGRERVHVAQSKRIRAIANSQEKNDANDAWWLAYLTHERRLPESYIPTGDLRELRIATRERRAAIEMRNRVTVRLRGHLRQMGVAAPARQLRSQKGTAFVRDLAAKTGGVVGRALEAGLEMIDRLDRDVADWERRIRELADGFPVAASLEREIPGVGPVLAATIAAEAGPLERFATAKAFARYTGLTPSDRSSGGKTTHGRITREGSRHLRWALTQAAVCCCLGRRGPAKAVGDWIRAKQRRMGSKAKAHVAAGRKLAENIWRLVHWGECFDVNRPFGAAAMSRQD